MTLQNPSPLQKLIDRIRLLKSLLDENGEYSICRSDGREMHWGDIMFLGTVLENIDLSIEEVEGLMKT